MPEANTPQACEACKDCCHKCESECRIRYHKLETSTAPQVAEGHTTETLEEFTKGAEEGTADSNAGRVRPLEDVVAELANRECLPDCGGAYACPGACPCWCHDEPANPVPDAAYLTEDDWRRSTVDEGAATEKAWRVFMAGIPVENLTADTQYAAAWGRHSRDTEVAWLQEQLERVTLLAERGVDLCDVAIQERDTAEEHARHMTSRRDDILDQATVIEEERDAALEQVRAARECGCHAADCLQFRYTPEERAEIEVEEAQPGGGEQS